MTLRSRVLDPILAKMANRFLRRIHRITHRMPIRLRAVEKQRVLVIAPHPDDEVIALGGTLALHRSLGSDTTTVYVTMDEPSPSGRTVRKSEAATAGSFLGYDCRFLDYPDGWVSRHEVAVSRDLEAVIRTIRPDLVYCPFPGDHHRDHQAVAASAAIALGRAGSDAQVWCYEVWSNLWPNAGIDVSSVIDAKRTAIESYKSQTDTMPYADTALALNRFRGLRLGVAYAEAFFVCEPSEFVDLCGSLGTV